MEDNFKIQLIATQALHGKYGFCPAPQQITLLESDGEGTYILFRIGEHEYRVDDGEITNLEDQKRIEEPVALYFGMFRDARLEADKAEKKYKEEIELLKRRIGNLRDREVKLIKRSNEQQLEIHRMKDRIRKMEPIMTELLGMIRED